MSYTPQSKIISKTTYDSPLKNNLFRRSFLTSPYVGSYIETSEGKYFVGTNFANKGEELIIINKLSNFGKGEDFDKYLSIKPAPYGFLKKITQIPAFKNIPTEKDYEKGYYNRYFSSRVNQQFGYKEINVKTYESIKGQQGKYDHHLYNVGLIKWAIKGNVHQINQLTLIQNEITFPYLSYLFPLFNEFHRPDLIVQTHLNTNGEELYYADGTEYIGSYHIHPIEGPMEGATHELKSHNKLYNNNNNNNPIIETNIDKEFEKYLSDQQKEKNIAIKKKILSSPLLSNDTKVKTSNTPSKGNTLTSNTPSKGNTSTSSGGRGGY
jgi:hypothetical protein